MMSNFIFLILEENTIQGNIADSFKLSSPNNSAEQRQLRGFCMHCIMKRRMATCSLMVNVYIL